MSETITRTITWHPAETAPKDEKKFTALDLPNEIFENEWDEKEETFTWGGFDYWTRDKVTP